MKLVGPRERIRDSFQENIFNLKVRIACAFSVNDSSSAGYGIRRMRAYIKTF